MILVVRVVTGLKTGTVLPSRVASLQDTVASLSGRDTRPVPPATGSLTRPSSEGPPHPKAAFITAPRSLQSPSSNNGNPLTSTSTHSKMDSRSSASPLSILPVSSSRSTTNAPSYLEFLQREDRLRTGNSIQCGHGERDCLARQTAMMKTVTTTSNNQMYTLSGSRGP